MAYARVVLPIIVSSPVYNQRLENYQASGFVGLICNQAINDIVSGEKHHMASWLAHQTAASMLLSR